MWGLSQLSRTPGPSDDSDISSPSQLNSCSSSSAGLAWARWRLAGWLSEESCRVSLNTAERAAQDTLASLCTGGYPPTCRITLPFTLRVSLFLLPVIRCQMSPELHRWGFSDVTAEDQLTGATAWCCHNLAPLLSSPLLRIIQPKHNNMEYIHQGDTQWPLNVVYNSVKHQRLGMQ